MVLVLAGCEDSEPEQTPKEVIEQVNADGTITDQQAEILSTTKVLYVSGLKSISDRQAESLSQVVETLMLNGLTSISDKQAEILSKAARQR